MLMDLSTLAWSDAMCAQFDVPLASLPPILSSAASFGRLRVGALRGVEITAVIGDQQAACVGQECFEPGDAKNTSPPPPPRLTTPQLRHGLVRARQRRHHPPLFEFAPLDGGVPLRHRRRRLRAGGDVAPCAVTSQGAIAMAGAVVSWFGPMRAASRPEAAGQLGHHLVRSGDRCAIPN
jgi:glycerol kinase